LSSPYTVAISPWNGHDVYGHTIPTLRVNAQGVTLCCVMVASRGEVIHDTSLAHEQGHCTLVLSAIAGNDEGDITGDQEHDGPMFTQYVPEANGFLAIEGL